MGNYFDIGNQIFREIKDEDYVDKSGLIAVVNRTIHTRQRLSCVSRPRRFGKTYAASMLAGYYCAGCDSSELFDDLEIAKDPSYRVHMNQYHVLYLDMSFFLSQAPDRKNLLPRMDEILKDRLSELYPDLVDEKKPLIDILQKIVECSGREFIAIIDEWDCPIRDDRCTEENIKDYLEFLRSLFKNGSITNSVFAAAYMTGILPMKVDGSQSAISEFNEYTIIYPEEFSPYVGFTEREVIDVCAKKELDFLEMKSWYDGYELPDIGAVYNPNSVMKAVIKRKFRSYWNMSAAAGSMMDYINLDYDGLGTLMTDLLTDTPVKVDIRSFKNDTKSFASANDVITLLIHFGYLSYDEESKTVRIPNREIREEFEICIRKDTHKETIERVRLSEEILKNTVEKNSDAVAKAIEQIHKEESSSLYYNDEQALRAVLKLAYFTYKDHYVKMEELHTGTGRADIVFVPRKYERFPALIVELKCGKSAQEAIDQIRERDYADVLKGYGGKILLVGISYEKAEKEHWCRIEEW